MSRRFREGPEDAELQQARKNAQRLQHEYDNETKTALQYAAENVEYYKGMVRQHGDRFEATLRQAEATLAVEQRRDARRRASAEEEGLQRRPSGNWRFEQMIDGYGGLIGWRVELEGKMVGTIMIRGNDLVTLSTSRDSNALRKAGVTHLLNDPSPQDIMAAFIKLYPDPEVVRNLPAPRRELPSGSPFGPSRDWSEE